ncbi:hypothetical protein L6452_42053 [Arctium lappa]|uniref:Uncharacterized protein n=1 Tax=Arctium lappa TaxID=4217 RepID=A0ACB8XID5_ARCLA|nr:hypothetical protein L6452_42053 [Arctium lappa]
MGTSPSPITTQHLRLNNLSLHLRHQHLPPATATISVFLFSSCYRHYHLPPATATNIHLLLTTKQNYSNLKDEVLRHVKGDPQVQKDSQMLDDLKLYALDTLDLVLVGITTSGAYKWIGVEDMDQEEETMPSVQI